MAVKTIASLPRDQQQLISKYITGKFGYQPNSPQFANLLNPILNDQKQLDSFLKDASLFNSPTTTTPIKQDELIPGTNIKKDSDQGSIELEAAREKQQGLDVLGQQQGIRQGVLSSLGDILGKQADAQLNYDLPGIKEQLNASGQLNSSALPNAVARERANLLAPQLAQLQQYGLGANDQYASGLGNILGNQQELQQGGLQRNFSVADYNKQSQLARDIGAQMTPQGPSPFLTGLAGAGQGAAIGSVVPGIGTGVGAGVGGAIGLIGGLGSRKGGGGTFLCTHLKMLGYMTQDEVNQVHDKIFTKSFRHFYSLIGYWILAPMFIVQMSLIDYPWDSLKKRLCDDILACETSEEAFQKYKSTCLSIMRPVFPVLCSFIFGKEKVHGY